MSSNGADIKVITSGYVSVNIMSVANSFGVEKRFPKDLTIGQLKGKLELLTGACSATMKLKVLSQTNKERCYLDNEDALLGSYPIDDGNVLYVEDDNLKADAFSDMGDVQKFELTAEEYAQKSDSLRAFKEKNKLGRFNPESKQKMEEANRRRMEAEEKILKNMKVGDRCQVRVPDQPTKVGTVKFIGTAHFKPGTWVGVQYDEPLGKNDGSVEGQRYFECPSKYGAFVKPLNVEVGDFPEEDYGLDEI